MVKKIENIANFGAFQKFNWDTNVTENNIPAEFKKVNILYGRNYSGKTTLSRIFRALETKQIPTHFESGTFSLLLDSNQIINQSDVNTNQLDIHVFNEDFIKSNLSFFNDPEKPIESFALFGEENIEIENKINQLEEILGSNENDSTSGLYLKYSSEKEDLDKKSQALKDEENRLEALLGKEATGGENSIKQRYIEFGEVNYNILKLKNDIDIVKSGYYFKFNDYDKEQYMAIRKETEKKPIDSNKFVFSINYSEIFKTVTDAIKTKIGKTNKIAELMYDTALNNWVKRGKELLSLKSICAFCGNQISDERWELINAHFDEESENLDNIINKLKSNDILVDKLSIDRIDELDKNSFYSAFHSDLYILLTNLKSFKIKYINALNDLIGVLDEKLNNQLCEPAVPDYYDFETEFATLISEIGNLIKRNNDYTANLVSEKKKAAELLRLNEVSEFIEKICYNDILEKKQDLMSCCEIAQKKVESTKRLIEETETEIKELKTQLNIEETKQAKDSINGYLKKHFANQQLELKSEEGSNDSQLKIYFKVYRNNEPAYNLSEGETRIIAFSYFMTKLKSSTNILDKPIIWIDDPISSLDSNHIFLVYSLIRAEVVEKGEYEQLFVSTHNLNFLKYLKRITGKNKDKNLGFYLIEKNIFSEIHIMPEYLREYTTEFNYLFEKIYDCAKQNNKADYYGFANNARKFIEILMFFNYPNHEDNETLTKLKRYFDDDSQSAFFIDRINNEYSHLSGSLERGEIVVDVPEIQRSANLILDKIKEKNHDQYAALEKSIGICMPAPEC